MKVAYRITVVLIGMFPYLRADDTDIGKFGHIISNTSAHKVHVHMDVDNKGDKERFIDAGGVWKTGETGKINAFEVRDDETGILVEKVKPAEDGGKYQVLEIEPGPNNGKFVGAKYSNKEHAGSRYKFKTSRLHDRW